MSGADSLIDLVNIRDPNGDIVIDSDDLRNMTFEYPYRARDVYQHILDGAVGQQQPLGAISCQSPLRLRKPIVDQRTDARED